jgi:hypothetical protein
LLPPGGKFFFLLAKFSSDSFSTSILKKEAPKFLMISEGIVGGIREHPRQFFARTRGGLKTLKFLLLPQASSGTSF